MPLFNYKSEFDVPAEELFSWHEQTGAFDRLNPPFMPVKVLHHENSISDGAKVSLKVPDKVIGLTWNLEHREYQKGKQFADQQISGPFKYWKHVHRFGKIDKDRSELHEQITYELPVHAVTGRLFDSHFRSRLDRLFHFRHTRTINDLHLLKKYKTAKPLKILIAGSSGMLGTELTAFLTTGGHQVTHLLRQKAKNAPYWSPETGQIDARLLENYDVIINLAGENIGSGYWTKNKKKRIRESRVSTTRLLAETISILDHPPRVFIAASATGYYGDQGEKQLTENSEPESGFFNEVVRAWEEASRPAARKGIRTVNLRFGVILSGKKDMLARVRPVFWTGLGAIIGSGENYFPWIAVDDAIAAIYHSTFTETLHGPVNVVAPQQVTSRVFFKSLGKILQRPVFLKVPAPVVKNILGDMGKELFLTSTRVIPAKLQESGFDFQFPTLNETLRFYLGR